MDLSIICSSFEMAMDVRGLKAKNESLNFLSIIYIQIKAEKERLEFKNYHIKLY